MKESGKKLAPPKLTQILNKMEQALKGCRRIAGDFNEIMKKEGRTTRVGKTMTHQIMKEMGMYEKEPPRKPNHLQRPKEPFTSFAMDFKEKIIAGGKHIHVLDLIDEFDNAIIMLDAYNSANGENVIASLRLLLFFTFHRRITIRCDHGKEFDNSDVYSFCAFQGILLDLTNKGCPWENAFVERNIRTLTEECLNLHWLNDISQTQDVLNKYKHQFNRRNNMGLGYRTPLEYLSDFYTCHRLLGSGYAKT